MRAQCRMFDARTMRGEATQGEGTHHNFDDGLKVDGQLLEKLTVLTRLHLLGPIAPGNPHAHKHTHAGTGSMHTDTVKYCEAWLRELASFELAQDT